MPSTFAAGPDPEPRSGLAWRKSTASASGACVEVASVGHTVLLRDSKDPSGAILRFTREEWNAFVEGVRAGEFG